MSRCLHFDLDGAWDDPPAGSVFADMTRLDMRAWGPRLRYHARAADIQLATPLFYVLPAARFFLYGSGDFHHLSGLLVHRTAPPGCVLVSFDNHPDWDIRPPRWACGGWINRALEVPNLDRAIVWGCGNFELAFPSRLFANHRALRNGRLEIYAWAERQSAAVQRRFHCMTRENWREQFTRFAESIAGRNVYVTVDMDCLRAEEAVTNWENGLFTAADVAWAIALLRSRTNLVAGDICGAYSEPSYLRRFQRFAGNWDHPTVPPHDRNVARRINFASLSTIWTELSAG
jgi:arginase family enzyme